MTYDAVHEKQAGRNGGVAEEANFLGASVSDEAHVEPAHEVYESHESEHDCREPLNNQPLGLPTHREGALRGGDVDVEVEEGEPGEGDIDEVGPGDVRASEEREHLEEVNPNGDDS